MTAMLQSATFIAEPPLTYSNGNEECAEFLGSGTIGVRPIAFTGKCCKLSSVLAHEAGHEVLGGVGAHNKIYYVELQCFGCNGFSK